MKKCITCEELLPLKSFKQRSDKKHKDIEDPTRYGSNCGKCDSLNTKLRFFNITKVEYEDLRTKFNDCCGICNMHEKDCWNGKTRHYGLYIDHDHVTGKVRGLLCHSCNLILGHAKDKVDILNSAIDYLTS